MQNIQTAQPIKPEHVKQLADAGIPVTETVTKVGVQERSKANAFKVDQLKMLLDIMREDEVNSVFTATLNHFGKLGYAVEDAETMIHKIDRENQE